MAITFEQLTGPRGLPLVGSAFDIKLSDMHNQLEEWADEYGPVYRLKIGPTRITVVTEPSIIQTVLRDRPDTFIRMKKMDDILRENGVHGVFNAEGEEWKLHRAMVAKGLDVKHQKSFFPQMLTTLERLYNKWERNATNGEEVNIQQDFLRFTVDITTTLAFGFEMNTLEEKGGVVQDHMEKIFPMIFKRLNAPIQWHKLLRSKSDREFDHAREEIFALIDTFIEKGKERLIQHPELRENPENFLDAILVAAEQEEAFGNVEIRGNLMTLLMAGEDTTAHTLAWSIFLLTKNPEWQSWLRDEADELLGENKWVNDYALTQQFERVDGVANETMRIKPVAPLLLFEPTEDVVIDGYFFEKGSRMLVQTRHAAMADSSFEKATEFNPKRWLKASRCPVHSMEAFVPFGGGPRYCPGRNLAMLEIKMVLSMLFKNFEVEMITPHEKIDEIMAFTMMASDYKVRLKHRTGV